MNSNELRKLFLDFFGEKGHMIKQSASLIPEDPGLLFTVAGMVPFKNYFLGKKAPEFKRAASSQKCIRTNDIENVGRTRRHHTFFEMLGNFSFGDYFKEEAIKWAWEFLTETVKLPKNRMYISIYHEDDESFEIWKNKIKIPENRIFRMGKETNFWQMAETGPCGYCSEIYFDLEGGEKEGVTVKDIEENDDRFLEIWNLVFTQFDRKADGSTEELEQKNIDTGMGLERLAAVSQGVYSNFESDLFMPIIRDMSEKCGVEYGKNEKTDVSLRVISDHARGVAFLIGDGVLPSNEGRGYVLRRVLRRAIRHGRLLGIKEPFLYKTTPVVMRLMGEAYPEITGRKEYIVQIVKLEEDKFQETMDNGMELLEQEIEKLAKEGSKEMPGETAFKLYDTYGFPAEITAEILEEKGMRLEKRGFEKEMEKQREAAKKAWKGVNAGLSERVPKSVAEDIKGTFFSGYEALAEKETKITALLKNGEKKEKVSAVENADIILEKTPFYAESGGQAGDSGIIMTGSGKARVYDTKKIDDIYVHMAKIMDGQIREGETAKAEVDCGRRKAIMKNHTATHLLHAALRKMLGVHVEQAGSYVGDDRMRFDFTHFSALSEEETKKTERLINKWIQEGISVRTDITDFEKAKNSGVIALFEEKYDEKVRMITIGDISAELCGGTHIKNTGEIGMFKIIHSGSTSAGVRRIEALTGMAACGLFNDYEYFVKEMKFKFKSGEMKELREKINKHIEEFKKLERQIERKKKTEVLKEADEYLKNAKKIGGINFIAIKVEDVNKKAVRELGDLLKTKTKNTISVIANVRGSKISFLAAVTDDLTEKFGASEIIKKVSGICGGGGGGRKDMAEAGGRDPGKIDEAFKAAEEVIKG